MSVGGGGSAQKLVPVVWHEKTDNCKGHDIEKADTPKHLLRGCRESLPGIGSLGRSKTDQLSTGESKCSIDEDAAQTLEAIMECTRMMPILSTNIAAAWATTTVENNTEDAYYGLAELARRWRGGGGHYLHEPNHSNDLDGRKDEFGFTVALDTKQVDYDNHSPKDGNPSSIGDIGAPIVDDHRSGDNLQG